MGCFVADELSPHRCWLTTVTTQIELRRPALTLRLRTISSCRFVTIKSVEGLKTGNIGRSSVEKAGFLAASLGDELKAR